MSLCLIMVFLKICYTIPENYKSTRDDPSWSDSPPISPFSKFSDSLLFFHIYILLRNHTIFTHSKNNNNKKIKKKHQTIFPFHPWMSHMSVVFQTKKIESLYVSKMIVHYACFLRLQLGLFFRRIGSETTFLIFDSKLQNRRSEHNFQNFRKFFELEFSWKFHNIIWIQLASFWILLIFFVHVIYCFFLNIWYIFSVYSNNLWNTSMAIHVKYIIVYKYV